jgi:hypothetical protein
MIWFVYRVVKQQRILSWSSHRFLTEQPVHKGAATQAKRRIWRMATSPEYTASVRHDGCIGTPVTPVEKFAAQSASAAAAVFAGN